MKIDFQPIEKNTATIDFQPIEAAKIDFQPIKPSLFTGITNRIKDFIVKNPQKIIETATQPLPVTLVKEPRVQQAIREPFFRAIEHPLSTIATGIQERKPPIETLKKAGESFIPFRKISDPKHYSDVGVNYWKAIMPNTEPPDWWKGMFEFGTAGVVEPLALKGYKAGAVYGLTRPATAEEVGVLRKMIDPIKQRLNAGGVDTAKLSNTGYSFELDKGQTLTVGKLGTAVLRGDNNIRIPRWWKIPTEKGLTIFKPAVSPPPQAVVPAKPSITAAGKPVAVPKIDFVPTVNLPSAQDLTVKQGIVEPTEGKVEIKSRKTSKEYGPSWDIIQDGKKVGWIGGYEGTDKFNLRQTEISNIEDRGKGTYQKAIQQVANLYPEGLVSKDFQMSTPLRKALLKIKTAIVNKEGDITIPPEIKLSPTGEGQKAQPTEGKVEGLEYHWSNTPNLIEGKTFAEQETQRQVSGGKSLGEGIYTTKDFAGWYTTLKDELGDKAPKNLYIVQTKKPSAKTEFVSNERMRLETQIREGQSVANPNEVKVIKKIDLEGLDIDNPKDVIKIIKKINNTYEQVKSKLSPTGEGQKPTAEQAVKQGIVEPAGGVETIADVENLIAQKSKEYGGRNKFLASEEYKKLYPQVEAIYAKNKGDFVVKAQQALKENGIKEGDKVSSFAQGFGGGESVSGTVIMKAGIPWVKLDSPQMTSQGYRKQVQWNKGWKLSPTGEGQKAQPTEGKVIEGKKYKNAEDFSKNILKDLAKKNNGIYDINLVYQPYQEMAGVKSIGKIYANEQLAKLKPEQIKEIALKHKADFIKERGEGLLNGKYGSPENIIAQDYFMQESNAIEKKGLIDYFNKLSTPTGEGQRPLAAEQAVKQGMSAEEWVESKMFQHPSGLKIKSATIEIAGRTYDGVTHSEAMQKALETKDFIEKDGEYFTKDGKKISIDWDLFRLSNGEVIDRLQADRMFGMSAIESLTKRKSQLLAEYEKAKAQPKGGGLVKPQYSISPEDYEKTITGKSIGKLGVSQKSVPPVTATLGKIEWEKTPAWQVNLGRNIAGIFEREIGPRLQVSKRLKKWLGVYYPMLGESGTIRVRTISDQQTLNHETGHFLDDALGGFPIEKRGIQREELIRVTKFLNPFEEKYTYSISPKTGKQIKKQDSYTAYRRSKPELFAEYIALYTQNPAKAKELAPSFTNIVEKEIAKNKEFAYVIEKLREFEAALKPQKDFVAALRKIPQIEPLLRDWEKSSNPVAMLYQKVFGDKIWAHIVTLGDRLAKIPVARTFYERRGLINEVFEIFRQMKKLIHGQQERLLEEITSPISKLSKEEQQRIAENLQDFSTYGQDALTDLVRKELAVWGNEARLLGLLSDEVFWNEVGQYFPFLYSTKEFQDMGSKYPTKQFSASFGAFKHRLTDEEMGRRVLEKQLGTWPSSKAKIDKYTKAELEEIGRKAREEMGLIKTAAYPLQKRIAGLIRTVYTVKGFNAIADIPGLVGVKDTPGYAQMPQGKRYGKLSGQYVPAEIVEYVSAWQTLPDDIDNVIQAINAIWKAFKVPYDSAAMMRNVVTNIISGWMIADVPMANPLIFTNGLMAYVKRGDVYKALRDYGMYRSNFSSEELEKLAFIARDPDSALEKTIEFAVNTFKIPGKAYGVIEDIFKTVIANYAISKGASVPAAVKLADKALFDYSSVSIATGKARKFFLPFITWSSKMFPRLLETMVRKPYKILFLLLLLGTINEINRKRLGITKEAEEKIKPEYLKGKTTILLPTKSTDNKLQWIDLSYFTIWDNFLPSQKQGKLIPPQALSLGNPFMTLYYAYVLNYDPYRGQIAPPGLPEAEQNRIKNEYVVKSLAPKLFFSTPDKIHKSTSGIPIGGRKQGLSEVLSGEFLGIKKVSDVSEKIPMYKRAIYKERTTAVYRILNMYRNKEINEQKKNELLREVNKRYLKRMEDFR